MEPTRSTNVVDIPRAEVSHIIGGTARDGGVSVSIGNSAGTSARLVLWTRAGGEMTLLKRTRRTQGDDEPGRSRRRRLVAAGAAVAAVAVLAVGLSLLLSHRGRPSISSPGGQFSPTPSVAAASDLSGPGGAVYIGPITSPRTINGGAFRLSVPDPDSQPGVDWQTAFGVCADGTGTCDPQDVATISLAVVTETDAGAGQAPIGTGSLMYVIEWMNEPCVPSGPPAGMYSGGRSKPVHTSHCRLVDFVDASNGAYKLAVEGPRI